MGAKNLDVDVGDKVWGLVSKRASGDVAEARVSLTRHVCFERMAAWREACGWDAVKVGTKKEAGRERQEKLERRGRVS